MHACRTPRLSRRHFLSASAAVAVGALLPTLRPVLARAADAAEFRIRAAPGPIRLARQLPETQAWSYNGRVPGPEIRVRQGTRLRIAVENALAEDTTAHWHGVRVPNAMDGVPHLTQAPIAPGEQVERGLQGPLIIDEPEPLRVDRDVTWVLDDWRLTQGAAISGDFGNRHDEMHGGRVGNTVTLNGRVPGDLPVRAGERIRLRLINAANARIFGLEFQGLAPVVIALDGQPVTPHAAGDLLVLGPAMRADLLSLAVAAGGAMVIVNTVVIVRAGLGQGEREVALALAAYGAGSMAVSLLLPRLLDRLADRQVMLAGAAAIPAGLALVALAPGFPVLLAVWLLLGAASSAVAVPTGRLLRRSSAPADRPAYFAAKFSLSHACWRLTYPLAGWAGSVLGLPATALLLAALALAGVLAAARLWPAQDPELLEHIHAGLPADDPHLADARPAAGGLRHAHAFAIDRQHRSWPSDADLLRG